MASAADRSVVSSFVAAPLVLLLEFQLKCGCELDDQIESFLWPLEQVWVLAFLNAALDLVIRLKDSILEALHHRLNRDEAHGFFEAFHTLIASLVSILAASIGFHFQGLGFSPLATHFATFLVFIMAAIVYSIAYMGIKLKPQGAEYLLLLRLISLVSGIIA
ncbi:hypothetical protein SO802_020503, partial [Lithocarpus litseifolius]